MHLLFLRCLLLLRYSIWDYKANQLIQPIAVRDMALAEDGASFSHVLVSLKRTELQTDLFRRLALQALNNSFPFRRIPAVNTPGRMTVCPQAHAA